MEPGKQYIPADLELSSTFGSFSCRHFIVFFFFFCVCVCVCVCGKNQDTRDIVLRDILVLKERAYPSLCVRQAY